ncbi:MAG TPA: M28 family peptidase [Blastocatellia bacterium]|nr:M28 family peptidase [Blastocatellia bacterium]
MRANDSLKRALTATLLAVWLAVAVAAASLPLPSREELNSITARDLKKHLSFLASDELGGRFTLSPGNRIAARYLASQLESFGYRGGARDGSYFQKVPLSYRSGDPASRVTFTAPGQTMELKLGDDFLMSPAVDASIAGDLVFVGYGISSPENKHDDYAGLDVKGKIVVLIAEDMPEALNGVTISDEEKGERAAMAHGAIGAIGILPKPMIAEWNQMKAFLGHPDQLGLPPLPTAEGKPFPSIAAGPLLINAIAKAMGKEPSYLQPSGKAAPPMAVPAHTDVKLKATVKEAPPAQNVVGILEGADPKLKDEYVVFSAHYDHLKTTDNGEVYNGADDDGSGTVSVLEIAQAFTVGPRPRRSILIIFHTGEELGLFGSEYNTDYAPVIPMAQLVADFNIDMIGRTKPDGDTDPRDRELSDKDTVYLIGSDKLSSELHRLSEATDNEMAHLKFDYRYNDEKHPERLYYRSDHYNYAKHGVPVIFYFTGLHRDYHRTTDDVDKIDFEKMEHIARMVFATGWRVANLDHRVVVDKAAARSAAR